MATRPKLEAKTKLVDGNRVDVNTGAAYNPSALSTQTLAPQADMTLPAVPTTATPSAASLDSSLAALPVQAKADRQAREAAKERSLSDIQGFLQDTPTIESTRRDAAASTGLDATQGEYDSLIAQITAEDERLRKETERIQNAPGTATTAERDREISELTRVSRRQRADLAIQALALEGKVNQAQKMVDSLVNEEKEYQERQLSFLQMAYEDNKDLFTEAEQREFELAQQDREAAIELQTYKLKAQYDASLKAANPLGAAMSPQSFEQFLLSKEAELGMNIDPDSDMYQRIRDEYNQQAQQASVGMGLYNEFDYRTANALLSSINKFQDEQVVKNFTNTQRALNIVNSIDANTKNPADHQTIVYNFAKALDPDSVVREGEYATVKKYAQSLADKYGSEIQQAVNGSGFLSPNAIAAIKKTMQNNYEANLPQYNNLKTQYTRNIDQISGVPGTGTRYLIDAEGGVPGPTTNVDEATFDSVVGGEANNGFLGFLGGALKVGAQFTPFGGLFR